MDTWAMLRFALYPVMLVSGVAWALLFWRQRPRNVAAPLAAGLGAAVAVQGAAGFLALLISPAPNGLTSAMFTAGVLAVALTATYGAIVMLREAWA